MDKHLLTQKIKRKALEVGFARVGITTADPIEGYEDTLLQRQGYVDLWHVDDPDSALRKAARTPEQEKAKADELMGVFAEFGALRNKPVGSEEVREQVKKLQRVITENYYSCTDEILASLGQMYAADGEFKQNIDRAGGEGTAEFVSRAIAEYCKRAQ